jgi:hypothetical protein
MRVTTATVLRSTVVVSQENWFYGGNPPKARTVICPKWIRAAKRTKAART